MMTLNEEVFRDLSSDICNSILTHPVVDDVISKYLKMKQTHPDVPPSAILEALQCGVEDAAPFASSTPYYSRDVDLTSVQNSNESIYLETEAEYPGHEQYPVIFLQENDTTVTVSTPETSIFNEFDRLQLVSPTGHASPNGTAATASSRRRPRHVTHDHRYSRRRNSPITATSSRCSSPSRVLPPQLTPDPLETFQLDGLTVKEEWPSSEQFNAFEGDRVNGDLFIGSSELHNRLPASYASGSVEYKPLSSALLATASSDNYLDQLSPLSNSSNERHYNLTPTPWGSSDQYLDISSPNSTVSYSNDTWNDPTTHSSDLRRGSVTIDLDEQITYPPTPNSCELFLNPDSPTSSSFGSPASVTSRGRASRRTSNSPRAKRMSLSGFSQEEKKSRSRDQNNRASLRYRQRKRGESESIEAQLHSEEARIAESRALLHALERKILVMKIAEKSIQFGMGKK